MKITLERFRNAAFAAQLVAVGLGFCIVTGRCGSGLRSGPAFFWSISTCFAIVVVGGLVVLVLTLRLREGLLPKLAFLLAGGSAVGLAVSFPVAMLMQYLARRFGQPQPFGPDGFAEFYALGVFPIAFLVGAVGGLGCLIRGMVAKRKTPG